ncbi:ATP-binding cassette domain-containing protein, partial [uncultured Anaerotruncus sp.]|uniref:ATP-binding cassette domain-containing protein n=1 Tax=uncultured Anaerotruncus sp. TaxID=905011 RepID=UPI002585C73F
MEHIVEIKNLKKHFGDLRVLDDINFHIDKGDVITVIGSSGSGKSSLLRCINLL